MDPGVFVGIWCIPMPQPGLGWHRIQTRKRQRPKYNLTKEVKAIFVAYYRQGQKKDFNRSMVARTCTRTRAHAHALTHTRSHDHTQLGRESMLALVMTKGSISYSRRCLSVCLCVCVSVCVAKFTVDHSKNNVQRSPRRVAE